MNLAQNLHFKRKQLHLTLEEVAIRIGATKQAIHKYENGIVTNIPLDRIEDLAKVLGVTPSWLIGWSTEPNDETKLQDLTLEEYEFVRRLREAPPETRKIIYRILE